MCALGCRTPNGCLCSGPTGSFGAAAEPACGARPARYSSSRAATTRRPTTYGNDRSLLPSGRTITGIAEDHELIPHVECFHPHRAPGSPQGPKNPTLSSQRHHQVGRSMASVMIAVGGLLRDRLERFDASLPSSWRSPSDAALVPPPRQRVSSCGPRRRSSRACAQSMKACTRAVRLRRVGVTKCSGRQWPSRRPTP